MSIRTELEFEQADAGILIRPSNDGEAYIAFWNGALVPARYPTFEEAMECNVSGFAQEARRHD